MGIKINIEFTLPEISATNVVTFNCHMNDFARGRYYMILGRDILTALGLNLKFSDNLIESDGGNFKGFTAPMVDLGTYDLFQPKTSTFFTRALI